ncbi:MAG: Gfo/Idh/MocA family oxidoreductase [Tannerella sp.]|jgi:predicted dehydrogenase|nr:Gfo/Idh/MocA family oxidoreductase [Tannerella sp.]
MEKLRVAVIGFGFMGKTHARNILNSNRMELTAIVDNRIDSISQVSGNIDTGEIPPEILAGISKYDNVDTCFAEALPDAVFVCVHTFSHYEIAIKALKQGLHVFIEKPFVLNVEEGERLIAEAKNRNLKLSVGHVVRYMPAYVKLHELYRNQTYGKLKSVSMTRFSGIPGWGEWDRLRKDFGSSGGGLFDLVIHDIDFLHYMLGMPDRVESKTVPGMLSNHDYVSAYWYYNRHDAFVKVEGGLTFHRKFPFEAAFRVSFEDASAVWSSSSGREMKIADNGTLQTIALEDAKEGYVTEAEQFAASIINNDNLACTAESALNTVKLCYKHII